MFYYKKWNSRLFKVYIWIEKLYLNSLDRFHGFHQSKLVQQAFSPYCRNDCIYFILFQNHLHELLIIYHTLPCTCEKIKLQSCMVMKYSIVNANIQVFFLVLRTHANIHLLCVKTPNFTWIWLNKNGPKCGGKLHTHFFYINQAKKNDEYGNIKECDWWINKGKCLLLQQQTSEFFTTLKLGYHWNLHSGYIRDEFSLVK